MDESLAGFIGKAKAKGLSDEEIKRKLLAAGWNRNDIDAALGDDLDVPKPPASVSQPAQHIFSADSDRPIAVVQNLSVRGFEYSIMFVSLWASAFSIMWLILAYVDDLFSKSSGTYYYGQEHSGNTLVITILLVLFPIFAYMFLRLKKAEYNDPTLRKDPSRRKLTQMTQLVSFLTAVGFTIYFVYSIISPDSTENDSMTKRFLQTLVALVVAGGIFLYYWREERR